jgi:hypothetical protein
VGPSSSLKSLSSSTRRARQCSSSLESASGTAPAVATVIVEGATPPEQGAIPEVSTSPLPLRSGSPARAVEGAGGPKAEEGEGQRCNARVVAPRPPVAAAYTEGVPAKAPPMSVYNREPLAAITLQKDAIGAPLARSTFGGAL